MEGKDADSGYELESNGEFEDAAVAFAQSGFTLLLNSEFESEANGTNEGIGWLLKSISCDRRAGNHRRPSSVAKICLSLLEEKRTSTDDTIDEGMLTELLADVKLVLGESDARDVCHLYDEAEENFTDVDWRAELRTAEPIYHLGYQSIHDFSEYHDGPLPVNPDSLSFLERLSLKREFTEQLLVADRE